MKAVSVTASVGACPRPADRFPHIALSLGQRRIDDAYWEVQRIRAGTPLAEMDHAELLSMAEGALRHVESLEALLAAVECAIPVDQPETLAQVIAPIRAYLKWTLDADTPFAASSAFVGEVARFGRPSVRVRVELEVVARKPSGPAVKHRAQRKGRS
ncbi:hypothetical protein ACIRVF_12195 [Kitasatospora sp. NPDC101157]|uniref:hypothetical protein n=1 Tax=Kitasatospora sp. NPDC101157 TaxID=3364098 RepID=UPI00380112A1